MLPPFNAISPRSKSILAYWPFRIHHVTKSSLFEFIKSIQHPIIVQASSFELTNKAPMIPRDDSWFTVLGWLCVAHLARVKRVRGSDASLAISRWKSSAIQIRLTHASPHTAPCHGGAAPPHHPEQHRRESLLYGMRASAPLISRTAS